MKPVLIDQDSLTPSPMIDFFHARRQANREELRAHLTGKSADLLSYEELCQKLKAKGTINSGLRDIPLDAIVGSVGRCGDFTRSFWPRHDNDQERWLRIKAAVTGPRGAPPIEVYQIGQVYFVLDGHHRVSVARELGATHIEAHVTKIHTRVPLTPDIQSADLVVKAEYADFLEQTQLDELRSGADLSMSVPGQYKLLEEQIQLHRRTISLERKQDIQPDEAVSEWYDQIYLPLAQIIRKQAILEDFPGRTETELYIWLSQHRATLKREFGYEIEPVAVATDLATRFSPKFRRMIARAEEKIIDAVTPDQLEGGPRPGQWRKERLAVRQADCLFADTLCLISGKGEEIDWQTLDQALKVAQRERGHLHSLHIVPSTKNKKRIQAMQAEFERRCQATGLPADLVIEVGRVVRRVCERARWADLVVLSLAHPPATRPLARLGSKFSALIRRCPRPVLVVPGDSSLMNRALLAYDGSPKADEALFVAARLCKPGRWNIPLTVVTVTEGNHDISEILSRAQEYLTTHEIQTTFVQESGSVAEAILKTAAAYESDLILMGSYGFSPMLEIALGSTVDQVLRMSRQPVLICR